jgi:hypothetical protein
MRRRLTRFATVVLLTLVLTQCFAMAQQPESNAGVFRTSGTLNIIFANKNGFVIAADSRGSSKVAFLCPDTHIKQLYCDNSQKLFRTTPNSVLVIAGFAVDRRGTALDLAIASVLLKQFGSRGWPNDDGAQFVPDLVKSNLSEALQNVSALDFPFNPEHFDPQRLVVTFARIDKSSKPVLRQLVYTEKLRQTPPLQAYVPEFEIEDSGEVPVTKFLSRPFVDPFMGPFVGMPYVAQKILDGYWTSTDPDILNYYEKKKHDELDSMPLAEVRKFAAAILHQTGKYIDKVGGEDQIGVFPVDGKGVEFTLPKNLPTDAQSIPAVISRVGLDCSGGTPCNGRLSMSMDRDRSRGTYKEFFLASQFRDMPIALENNIFIGNDFDHVTFMWNRGNPLLLNNTLKNCTLEVPQSIQTPNIPGLQGCAIVKKAVVTYPLDTVGARRVWNLGPGIFVQPQP